MTDFEMTHHIIAELNRQVQQQLVSNLIILNTRLQRIETTVNSINANVKVIAEGLARRSKDNGSI